MAVVIDIPTAVTVGEREQLQQLAAGQIVLELGAHYGASTIALAQVARRVHSIDWHMGDDHAGRGDSLPEFMANLERYGVREGVVVHVGRFEDVLPTMRPKQFDLAFIDGFHDYNSVLRDAWDCKRVVRAGGVLAFHDYGSPSFEVTRAVQDFARPVGMQVNQVESLAWVQLP